MNGLVRRGNSRRPSKERDDEQQTLSVNARVSALLREVLDSGGGDWETSRRRVEQALQLLDSSEAPAPASAPTNGPVRRLVTRIDDVSLAVGAMVRRKFSFTYMPPRVDAQSQLNQYTYGGKVDAATEDMLLSFTAPGSLGPGKDGAGLKSFGTKPMTYLKRMRGDSGGAEPAPAAASAPAPAPAPAQPPALAQAPSASWFAAWLSKPTHWPSAAPELAHSLSTAVLDVTYDVDALDDATSGRCLTCIFEEVLTRQRLLERLTADGLAVDVPKLRTFLRHLETSYGGVRGELGNAYHNRKHAADVALTLHRFLADPSGHVIAPASGAAAPLGASSAPSRASPPAVRCATGAPASSSTAVAAGLSALDEFAALIAAAVHDYNHPGTGNAHEIKVDSPLAIRYHDRSVLEAHHLASAFSELLRPEHNFVAAWDRKAYMAFRELIVQLVLMTDLSKHIDFVAALESAADQCEMLRTAEAADGGAGGESALSTVSASMVLTCAIKAADLGHTLKPWALHQRWSGAIATEFFAMGDVERARGLPISPYCDRHRDVISKVQIGFLNFVCKPFFVATARLLPAHSLAVEQLEENIRAWADAAVDEPCAELAA